MMSLNLLSPEKKKKLKEKKTLFAFRYISYFCAIFLIINLLLFYGTKLYLNHKLDSIKDEVSQATANLPSNQGTSLNNAIQEINKNIILLADIQSDYVKWSNYLTDFTALIPANILLNQLSLNQESKEIQINGHADQRDDFLVLKANLENTKIISDLNSPISNLIKKEDIDFVITAKIVLDNYKL
ncbi:MAG: hypothetical protein ABIH38_01835 [Patescibacteria group bacterium]